MKQLIIAKDKPYSSGVTYNDITLVEDGALAFFNPADGTLITCHDDIKGNFAVVCGRGKDKLPLHFPEVDVKTLVVEKAEYAEGTKFSASITVPDVEKGKTYTLVVAKHGVVFNERNLWSASVLSKGDVAEDVAKDIAKQINANSYNSGVSAEAQGNKIVVTAIKDGVGFSINGADELMGVEVTDVKEATPEILGKAYVQDLASRCAAGKGFNYLAEDGKDIYPGYPEEVEDTEYAMYTLRFAVPRMASKQRDEVVYQLLHIVLPKDSDAITSLDDILGTYVYKSFGLCGMKVSDKIDGVGTVLDTLNLNDIKDEQSDTDTNPIKINLK